MEARTAGSWALPVLGSDGWSRDVPARTACGDKPRARTRSPALCAITGELKLARTHRQPPLQRKQGVRGKKRRTRQTPGDRGQGEHPPGTEGASPPRTRMHNQEEGAEATAGRSRFQVETAAVGIQRILLTSRAQSRIQRLARAAGTCTHVPWHCRSLKQHPRGAWAVPNVTGSPPVPSLPGAPQIHHRHLRVSSPAPALCVRTEAPARSHQSIPQLRFSFAGLRRCSGSCQGQKSQLHPLHGPFSQPEHRAGAAASLATGAQIIAANEQGDLFPSAGC